MLRAANLGHWSGQWVEFLHSQHLWLVCFVSSPPCAWRWLTLRRLFELDLNGAVAHMRDFIFTDIHSMSRSKVAFPPWRSKSRDQTFRSSGHIFCSMIDNIWLLSISFWLPTSLRVLKLRLTKWTKSQNRASPSGCRGLNLTMSWVIVSDTNLGSP